MIKIVKMKLDNNPLKPNFRLAALIFMALVASACAPTQPAARHPQAATNTNPGSSNAPVGTTTTSAATETVAAANLPIAPETLGQIRLLWNADFPGDLNRDTNCNPSQQECTLYTNIAAYAFSRDGSTLAAAVCTGTRTADRSKPDNDTWGCTGESTIIFYDSATGDERNRLTPAALPLSLAFHPDGTILAAGLANSDIEVWDLVNSDLVNTLSDATKYEGVRQLAFAPDGNLLISGSGSGFQIQVRDWPSATLLATIEPVIAIGISPDGGKLVTLHLDNEPDAIRVYDLAQIEQFSEISLAGQYAPTEFSFNLQKGWISSVEFGSNSYIANFWSPESNANPVATLEFNQDYEQTGVLYDLNSGGFTPGGYFLLTRTGQLTTPEAQPEATGLNETLWACGFALADVEANQIFSPPAMLFDECTGPEYMYDGAFTYQQKILSPDGRFIAGEDGFGNLRVWGVDASLPAVPPDCSGDC